VSTLIVAVILALAVGLAVGGFSRPGFTLALVFCSFGLEQLLTANGELFSANPAVWNIAVAAAVGSVLFGHWVTGRYRFRGGIQPAQGSILVFVAVFILSAQWSPVGDSWDLLQRVGPYMAVFMLAAPLLVQVPDDGAVALKTVAWISIGICIYVMFDRSIWNEDEARLALRVLGPDPRVKVSNPMAIGDIGALAFVIGSLAPGLQRWDRPTTWLRYAGLALALYVTARSSRGETVAAIVAVALVSLVPRSPTPDGTRRSIPGVLGFLGFAAVASTALTQALGSASRARYETDVVLRDAGGRFDATATMWRIYSNDPSSWLLGLGANYSDYAIGGYPHNQAIQAITETGIVGFLFWIGGPLLALWSLTRVWRLTRADAKLNFAAEGYLAVMLYFLVTTTKRGHVLDAVTMMSVILVERFAHSVREQASERAAVAAAPTSLPPDSRPTFRPLTPSRSLRHVRAPE
jgi:hypothetical protein